MITLDSNLTLKEGQRIITTEMKRLGRIDLCPYNVSLTNDYPVHICFDDGDAGWVRPSHLKDYTEN